MPATAEATDATDATALTATTAPPGLPAAGVLAKLADAARWTVVGPAAADAVLDALPDADAVRPVAALRDARLDLENGEADLVVLDAAAGAGDLGRAVRDLNAIDPAARVVVASARPSLAEATAAVRAGAVDYLSLGDDDVAARLRAAAGRRWLDDRTRRRMNRLKRAVRRLNRARRAVSRRVDLLCGDFVSAYGDVAEQVERVRLTRSLGDLLDSAADMEQLLCHAMDWLLRHAGHCNIAVFLNDDSGGTELGAYMKHTVPGDDAAVDWLAAAVLPRVAAGAGVVEVAPQEYAAPLDLTDDLHRQLAGQRILGATCDYLAEPLATILVFRDEAEPFDDAGRAALATAADLFGRALTGLVRGDDDADLPVDCGDDDEDEEDWWKRGEAAPY